MAKDRNKTNKETREQILRAMHQAEGLSEPGVVMNQQEEKLAREWRAFSREGVGAGEEQSIPVPDLVFQEVPPLAGVRPVVSSSRGFFYYGGAAAAALLLGFFVYFYGVTKSALNEPVIDVAVSQLPAQVTGPHRLKGPSMNIQIQKGQVGLKKGAGPEGVLNFKVRELTADFDFKKGVNVRIDHPVLSVSVTGTRFRLTYGENTGSVHLTEGSLDVRYHSQAGDSQITMKAPARLDFSPTAVTLNGEPRPIKPLKHSPPPVYIWQEFELNNGQVLKGRVLSGDENKLRIKTKNGQVIVIQKRDLKRTRL